MQRYRQRFAHRGNFERNAIGNRQQIVVQAPTAHQQFLDKRTFWPAAADKARGVHRVEDHGLANRDAFDIAADFQHLASTLMAQRSYGALARNAAVLDIGQVTAANAAGLHPHHHVAGTRRRALVGIEPDIIDIMNGQAVHRSPPIRTHKADRWRCPRR